MDKQDKLVVETGRATPGCVNIDEQYCFKYGKHCDVYIRCSSNTAIDTGKALFTLPWNIKGAGSGFDLEGVCVLWDGPEKDPVNAALKYWQGARSLDLQRNLTGCKSLAFHLSYMTD